MRNERKKAGSSDGGTEKGQRAKGLTYGQGEGC